MVWQITPNALLTQADWKGTTWLRLPNGMHMGTRTTDTFLPWFGTCHLRMIWHPPKMREEPSYSIILWIFLLSGHWLEDFYFLPEWPSLHPLRKLKRIKKKMGNKQKLSLSNLTMILRTFPMAGEKQKTPNRLTYSEFFTIWAIPWRGHWRANQLRGLGSGQVPGPWPFPCPSWTWRRLWQWHLESLFSVPHHWAVRGDTS